MGSTTCLFGTEKVNSDLTDQQETLEHIWIGEIEDDFERLSNQTVIFVALEASFRVINSSREKGVTA